MPPVWRLESTMHPMTWLAIIALPICIIVAALTVIMNELLDKRDYF